MLRAFVMLGRQMENLDKRKPCQEFVAVTDRQDFCVILNQARGDFYSVPGVNDPHGQDRTHLLCILSVQSITWMKCGCLSYVMCTRTVNGVTEQ